MKLLPLLIQPPIATLPRGRLPLAAAQAALPPMAHRDAGEPDWRSAYQRLREQQPAEPEAPAAMPALPAAPVRDAPAEPATTGGVSPTPTVERIAAARQIAEAQPAATEPARSWKVELPAAAGPAWRLHIEQAQPLAPLHLELHVPPVAQTQARQQLGDLDKRLRDAGHEVLRSRLRQTTRADRRDRPIDEVQS